MIPHVQRLFAVLLAAGAIIYPLFNFAPKLYHWFVQQFIAKLYRRLRVVEAASQTTLSAPEVAAMQAELGSIDRMARILPKRHSDLFFALAQHIESTRIRLASR